VLAAKLPANHAMQRTAGRSDAWLMIATTSYLKSGALSPAVADLESR
jgi:hypothetical protein